MSFWEQFDAESQPPTIQDIHRAPAHLIRRCHQISVAMFVDELGEHGLTPVQYASLLAIRDYPGIDQRGLGHAIAIDRSTIATVLRGLEERDLIVRERPPDNLRVKRLSITAEGDRLLTRTVERIARVQQRLLAPLAPEERETFIALLSRLVQANNDMSRVPLRLDIARKERASDAAE